MGYEMTDVEAKLTTPNIRVVMDDGHEYTVRILNADMVGYDRERGRHRDWPAAGDAPLLWATYLAWHAMTRTNQIARMNLAEFETRALQVEILEPDAAGGDDVDPTRTEAEPG